MRPDLRHYQQRLKDNIYDDWCHGADNVLAVMPTGAGKTVSFSDIISEHQGYSCAIAHRQELVGQISLSLGRFGLEHRILAPRNIIGDITNEHRRQFGKSYVNANAEPCVAGVDTLVSRAKTLTHWASQVTLWVCDEAHHVLENNKWGTGTKLFHNARGLGVTATPRRADGKGLGAHASGRFHTMVIGPSMRDLINEGSLTEYKIVTDTSDINTDILKLSKTGDFSLRDLKAAAQKSHIIGDVVKSYMIWANGLQGIVFATDVETAEEIADNFTRHGIKAYAVSAKTPEAVRNDLVRRFRNGDVQVLVNVDLFGEGFDLPAVQVVSLARPTFSLAVYMQQFGRVLRPSPGKQYGLVIDHVKNWHTHNLPDVPRLWTLDDREGKRGPREIDEEAIQLTSCLVCFQPYERIKTACPWCGAIKEPVGRSSIAQVDGDLALLDFDTLVKIREAVAHIDRSPVQIANQARYATGDSVIGRSVANKHIERQRAQEVLRNAIAIWAGKQRAMGRPDRESYKLFYLRFGIDVLSAQALGRPEAEELTRRIEARV